MRVWIELITWVSYNGRLLNFFYTFILTAEGGDILTINILPFSQINLTTRDDRAKEFCHSSLTRSRGLDKV